MDTSSESKIELTDENLRFVKELAKKLDKTQEEMVNMIVKSFGDAGIRTRRIMSKWN